MSIVSSSDALAIRREIWYRAKSAAAHITAYTDLSYPVYIPSKGRTGYRLTADLLSENNVPYLIVVEPQDEADYRTKYGDKVLCLPDNNQGVAFVRNFIKEHAAENGHAFHWQLDDNITRFTCRQNGKNASTNPLNSLSAVENITDLFLNIGGSCLSSNVYAFAFERKEPVTLNVQVYSAMLLNSNTAPRFRKGTHEDTDYSLQILSEGLCTLVFRQINIEKVASGKMAGGNTDSEYADGRKLQRLHNTVTAWPDRFRVGKHRKGKLRLIPTNGYRGFYQIPKPADPVSFHTKNQLCQPKKETNLA